MCGIIGYFGPKNPKEMILRGLKNLEYRGYDSAGLAIFDQGAFKRVRVEGKVEFLNTKLQNQTFNGALGIGHTRWATHGKPSEINAHPHHTEGVSIVHNGIIENCEELKSELAEQGKCFESETDSELIAHLVSNNLEEGQTFFQAVFNARKKLRGAYSVLAVCDHCPNELIAFKNGPPLIIGFGKNSLLIASDLQAIVEETKEVVYLEDHDFAHCKEHEVNFFDTKGLPINKTITTVDWSLERIEKQGYPHFMLKEIFEQPRAIAAAIEPHITIQDRKVQLNIKGLQETSTEDFLSGIDKIFIVACGTSFYAAQVGKYFFEKFAKIPVETDIASEFRYRNPVFSKNSLFITISQSGETADTLAALRLAQQHAVKTLSLCNVPNATIDRESQACLYMKAGVEIGVASTKAFVCSLTVLQLIAVQVAKNKSILSQEDEEKFVSGLIAMPSHMEKVLAYDNFFRESATLLKTHRGFLYMGRGVNFPIAMEGALKLKELAYLHAEGYAAGEMKHGPLALIDSSMAVVVIAPDDDLYEKTLNNLEEVKARSGRIIAIGTEKNKRLIELSEHYLSLPKVTWNNNPVLAVVPLQLMSYHLAHSLGHNVDQPRNLAKSVTVE